MEALDTTVPITRADYYVHEAEAWGANSVGIEHLDADRITVLIDQVVEGVVTLGARGPDPHDGYGYEFDLTPESARVLAERLTAAAAEAAEPGVAPAPEDVP